ncbi:MAG: tetratricopeptide repeat protein [Chloroflexi bacterium]|nr:tetratricopeptide repeat protein [Chloroflexota bacterium]MEB2367567.1 tetratricopeptide repeat protein [Chloroflexota bacterium]
MDVPTSGRSPLPLDPALSAALDAENPADERDPFVCDTDANVRRLGRVAVRRSHIDDVFALGDACAALTFNAYDAHMSAAYAEKALTAYRRAQQVAETPEDRAAAESAAARFVDWAVATALQFPSRRNISVALWAAALLDGPHASHIVDATLIERMLSIYRDRVTAAERRYQVQTRGELRPSTQVEDATRVDLGIDHLISQDMLPPRNFDSPLSHTAEASPIPPSASSHMASSLDLTPEAHFGRDFGVGEIIEGIGEVMTVRYGGMGVVYLCYDHERGEPAAVKTFQGRFWNNKRAETRFHKEALTWIQLEKHPNIVQARRVHTVGGRPHIVLEHVSGPENLGPDLSNWIKHRRVTLENAVDFALQIARAMRHAAAKFPGMVHRDIKPANILVTHDGTAKVTDFGLVYSVLSDAGVSDDGPITSDPVVNPSDRLTRADAVVGTYAYMSPEQWVNDPSLDLRSDIYAFGCVLYEMLVGKTVYPYRHKAELKRAHLEEQPEFDEAMEQKIPLSLRSLVLWCLEKDRAERPQTWDEIAGVLRDITLEITGSEPAPEPEGVPLAARELVDKGYSLTELGRYDQALQAFDQAIAKQPGLSYAWARKGRTLRLLERYEDALACYDRALEIQPSYAWALSGKGVILERMGRFEEALACFQQASEMHPQDVWYVHNMGSAYLNLGQLADAEAALRRAVEIDPAHSSSWARLGQVLRQLDRPEEALGAFEQAIKLDPTYAWAHNGLGLTQKMLGRTRDALNSFLRATRYQPNVVMHWYSLTEMYIDLGQVQDALDPARRATELDPNYALSWAKLGQVLRYLKRYDEALSAYDRALSIDPSLTWAVNGRGVVLEQTGRYDEALECYRQAAEQAPDDVWYQFNQGNVLLLMDRSAEAIEPLRRSVEMDPASARFWTRLGKAYRQLGDYERALDACRTAVRLADQLASAWSELGATLEAMEQNVEALDAYRRAVELSDDPFYTTKQTDLLSQIGKNQTAAELLEQALQRDPNNGQLWGKYGQALRRLRRLDEAMVAYSRAIDLDPSDAWAWGGHGLTLGEYGRHVEALESFDRALELNQDDPWLWYNRAEELLALNRAHEAIESLQRALALRPDHAESWAKRGHALRKLGKLEDALVAFDKAVQVMPGYAWAWNGRALTLRELRRRDDALLSYQRAVREDPNNLWYRINQIDLLLDMRKAHEALQVATTLIDYAADSSVAWARHGQVLRRLHRYQDALGSYERALLLDPRYAWAWNGKGMSLFALERYDEALACYEQATTLAPGDPWFWYNYGEALMRMGDIEGAKRRYRSALQADPRHQASKERLNEL